MTSELPQVREDGVFDGSDESSPNTEDLQVSPEDQPIAMDSVAAPLNDSQQVAKDQLVAVILPNTINDEDQQVTKASNEVLSSTSLPRDAKLATQLDPPTTPSLSPDQGKHSSSHSVTTPSSILGVRSTSHSINTLPSLLDGQNTLDRPRSRTGPHRSPPVRNGPFGRNPSSSSSSGHIADLFRRLGESPNSSPLGATPPYNRSPSSRGTLLSEHSWEVVSKYSSTSNRLSILQDQSDPDYDLVPLWECLQVCGRGSLWDIGRGSLCRYRGV